MLFPPPTTTCLTLLRWLIASSSRLSVALTMSGGVRASHWFKLMSWKVSVLKISRKRRVVLPMFST